MCADSLVCFVPQDFIDATPYEFIEFYSEKRCVERVGEYVSLLGINVAYERGKRVDQEA